MAHYHCIDYKAGWDMVLLCIFGWLENGGFGIVWLGLGFGSTSV